MFSETITGLMNLARRRCYQGCLGLGLALTLTLRGSGTPTNWALIIGTNSNGVWAVPDAFNSEGRLINSYHHHDCGPGVARRARRRLTTRLRFVGGSHSASVTKLNPLIWSVKSNLCRFPNVRKQDHVRNPGTKCTGNKSVFSFLPPCRFFVWLRVLLIPLNLLAIDSPVYCYNVGFSMRYYFANDLHYVPCIRIPCSSFSQSNTACIPDPVGIVIRREFVGYSQERQSRRKGSLQ